MGTHLTSNTLGDNMKTTFAAAIIFTVLMGYTMAASQYAPAPYAPAPYNPQQSNYEEKVPPQPFAYEYGGVDYNGRAFQKHETQDEYGVVQGEYRVELPDGRTQVVTYDADHEGGFVADVRYEGEAKPYVAEPYQPAPPKYKPASYAQAPDTQYQ